MSDAADRRIAQLEQEKQGVEQMLALVLMAIDEPVVVYKSEMSIPNGAQIKVDDDIIDQRFIFSMEYPDE